MSDHPEYYTVVYCLKGGKQLHNEWWQSLRPLFLADDAPISISVIARGDLAARVDELEGVET